MTTIIVTAHLIAALNQHPTVSLGIPEEPPAPVLGPERTGRATYYGRSYNASPLGCGGTYWSWDSTIIAVGPSRYREWPCGTPLLVTGPSGSLTGTRRDSCPGCDAHGVIVDLSESGYAIACGSRGPCTVTVQEVRSGGWRAWRELAL